MNIIYSASGAFVLFFIALLLSKKNKLIADYLLGGWFLLIFMAMATIYLNHNQFEGPRLLFDLTDTSVYLHGPLLWFYTRSLIQNDFRFRWHDVWHLFPFIGASTCLLSYHISGIQAPEVSRIVILISKMGIMPFYGLAILKLLRNHKKKIDEFFSNTERITLNWLKLLVWSLLVIWTISVISLILFFIAEVPIPDYGGLLTNLALSIFVLIVGYFGIRQTSILVPAKLIDNPEKEVPQKHHSKASFSKEVEDPNFNKLLAFMAESRPFLNSDLTLQQLAIEMELPSHQLSQLINRFTGTNFFNFVNQYRVEAFKQKIREKAHLKMTLLAVSEECGFNSKASFNRVFKKMTGQTPRQFVYTQGTT